MPWEPLLTDEEVQRAEGYYGTGRRIRRVAAKLLAGQPIQVRAGGWAGPAGEEQGRWLLWGRQIARRHVLGGDSFGEINGEACLCGL